MKCTREIIGLQDVRLQNPLVQTVSAIHNNNIPHRQQRAPPVLSGSPSQKGLVSCLRNIAGESPEPDSRNPSVRRTETCMLTRTQAETWTIHFIYFHINNLLNELIPSQKCRQWLKNVKFCLHVWAWLKFTTCSFNVFSGTFLCLAHLNISST